MSRTPARVTQADIARAIRAAQQTGAGDVIVAPDGCIVIRSEKTRKAPREELDEETVVPL